MGNLVGNYFTELETRADIVFTELQAGYTALWARAWLGLLAPTRGVHGLGQSGAPRTWTVNDMGILGDGATRIKSVHAGTNTIPSGWYRQT